MHFFCRTVKVLNWRLHAMTGRNTSLTSAVILKTAGMVAEANGSGNEQTFSGLLQHRDF